MPDAAHNEEMSTLIGEHNRVCSEIRSIESANDKILNIGVSLITLGLLYGINSHIEGVYFLMPPAILSLFIYAILQYYFIAWFGGYKRNIEEMVNLRFKKNILTWEHVRQARTQMDRVFVAAFLMYSLIMVAIIAVCLHHIFESYSRGVAWIYAGDILAMILLIPLLIRSVGRAHTRSYDIARKLSSQDASQLIINN